MLPDNPKEAQIVRDAEVAAAARRRVAEREKHWQHWQIGKQTRENWQNLTIILPKINRQINPQGVSLGTSV